MNSRILSEGREHSKKEGTNSLPSRISTIKFSQVLSSDFPLRKHPYRVHIGRHHINGWALLIFLSDPDLITSTLTRRIPLTFSIPALTLEDAWKRTSGEARTARTTRNALPWFLPLSPPRERFACYPTLCAMNVDAKTAHRRPAHPMRSLHLGRRHPISVLDAHEAEKDARTYYKRPVWAARATFLANIQLYRSNVAFSDDVRAHGRARNADERAGPGRTLDVWDARWKCTSLYIYPSHLDPYPSSYPSAPGLAVFPPLSLIPLVRSLPAITLTAFQAPHHYYGRL
ncbi:hypothetical protein DFH09DRAFT_1291082 [Mycena vulgaris]|nr:hypothetical protein DFH09DRAFT_1291082 [Mycena vulgaris]